MRKWIVWILLLCLCGSAAASETAVTEKKLDLPDSAVFAEMDRNTGRLILTGNGEEDVRWLADTDLKRLSGNCVHLIDSMKGFFDFRPSDSPERTGLMDADGNPVVPALYDDVNGISGRWAAGILFAPGTEDDSDYISFGPSGSKEYYSIDTVDLYFSGRKVGSLTRQDWAWADGYGDYLLVMDRSGSYAWYSKDFVRAESTDPSEYYYDAETGTVMHSGSGRAAFSPDCTLAEEEVGEAFRITPERQLVDLKGNVLADFSSCDYVMMDERTGLFILYGRDGKKGYADQAGRSVVPVIYDSLFPVDESAAVGYVHATRDGKDGFVNLGNGEETGFTFDADSRISNGLFFWTEDPEGGGVLLFCPGAGELPELFQEVEDCGPYMLVKKADDTLHLIDVCGAEVLPAGTDLSGYITVTADGSQILLERFNDETGRPEYTLFTVFR